MQLTPPKYLSLDRTVQQICKLLHSYLHLLKDEPINTSIAANRKYDFQIKTEVSFRCNFLTCDEKLIAKTYDSWPVPSSDHVTYWYPYVATGFVPLASTLVCVPTDHIDIALQGNCKHCFRGNKKMLLPAWKIRWKLLGP